jgi:hypothetical protein
MRTTWKLINELTRKTSNSKNNFEAMVNENTSKLDIANGFNNFFTKIGPSLANKINPIQGNITEYLNKPNQSSMLMTPILEKELKETINSFQGKSSIDCHGLNMNIIKQTSENIITPLLSICNQSFQQGKFPDMMKNVRVIGIFKSGDIKQYTATIVQYPFYHNSRKYSRSFSILV